MLARHFLRVLGALLLCAAATVPQVQAQVQPREQRETAPDFAELHGFGEAVGDRRIVLLDELTHGEHENFALKARLVRYLHQKKGFDALVIESGLFDVARIWQTQEKPIREQAPGNIFYMYAHSAPVNALFDYIDRQRDSERPLELAGFDGRLSGEYSLAGAAAFIKNQSEQFLPRESAGVDWPEYLAIVRAALAREPGDFTDAQRARFIDTSYRLIRRLDGLRSEAAGYERPDYVARLLHGLVIVAQNLWGTRRHDEHDIAMADNLRWLLENPLKDKKVIVWGHFIHLNYGGTVPHRYDNLGTLLRREYGKQMYLAHIAASEGQYRDYVDMQVKEISAPQTEMLEPLILRDQAPHGDSAVFLDGSALDRVALDSDENARFFGHQYAQGIAPRAWSQYWDGMFVLPRSTASAATSAEE